MKITATKVKRELIKNHGWTETAMEFYEPLIKDALNVIDKILQQQKGIKIK